MRGARRSEHPPWRPGPDRVGTAGFPARAKQDEPTPISEASTQLLEQIDRRFVHEVHVVEDHDGRPRQRVLEKSCGHFLQAGHAEPLVQGVDLGCRGHLDVEHARHERQPRK